MVYEPGPGGSIAEQPRPIAPPARMTRLRDIDATAQSGGRGGDGQKVSGSGGSGSGSGSSGPGSGSGSNGSTRQRGYTGAGNDGHGSDGQGSNFAGYGSGGAAMGSPGNLEPGDRVSHERFGEGEVMAVEGEAPNTTALINFKSTGTKKLLLRFAKLTRL